MREGTESCGLMNIGGGRKDLNGCHTLIGSRYSCGDRGEWPRGENKIIKKG